MEPMEPMEASGARDRAIAARRAALTASGRPPREIDPETRDAVEWDLWLERRRLGHELDPLGGIHLRSPTNSELFRIRLGERLGLPVLIPRWWRNLSRLPPPEDLREIYSVVPSDSVPESTG